MYSARVLESHSNASVGKTDAICINSVVHHVTLASDATRQKNDKFFA